MKNVRQAYTYDLSTRLFTVSPFMSNLNHIVSTDFNNDLAVININISLGKNTLIWVKGGLVRRGKRWVEGGGIMYREVDSLWIKKLFFITVYWFVSGEDIILLVG